MKTAKRTLAVLLALLMAFGTFSIAGSATMNSVTTMPELWEGAGTITYGLDVYKVDGEELTKVDSGSTLSPGDVVEVRVSFGTNFITYQVNTLIFYDTKYFVPVVNGTASTELNGKIFEQGFATTYEDTAPSGTLAAGGSATFYNTLSTAAGLTGAINTFDPSDTKNDRNKYYPTYMREGYDEGATIKSTTPVAEKYQDLGYTYASFTAGSDSTLKGQFLASVPYATYYSFRMQVVEGADSEGALTSIFIPALAQKTKKADNMNKLFGGTSSGPAYAGSTLTMYGQGIDVTNGEFEAVIGESAQPHVHSWDEGTVTTEPTCTDPGVMTYNCTGCDETKTEEIAALGHDYEAVVTEPTCTDGGFTTYTCSRCYDIYTDDLTDALGHDYVGEETTAPTCGAEGEMTYTCSRCGDTYTEAIPATGDHSYDTVVTEPTCTEGGYTTYTCVFCGDSYTDNETDALGHTWDEGVETIAPSCRDGEMTYTCSRCGETRTEAIPGTGDHVWGAEEVTAEPTCDTEGETTYTCSKCGETKTEPIPALGHDWDMTDLASKVTLSDDNTEATLTLTCKRDASHEYTLTVATTIVEVGEATCTLGGKVNVIAQFTDEEIGLDYAYSTPKDTQPLGHDYVGVETTAATCTEDGLMTYTCSRCEDTYTETIDALGHDYVAVVTEPTCTEGGYTTYTCSRCEDTYTADETEALGHAYDAVVTDPTCTEGGRTTYTCSRCGDSYTDNETEALGHSFTNYVSDGNATCTADGTKTAKCDRCDATDTIADEGSMLPHTFVNYVSDGNATCTADGTKTAKCENCDATDTIADEGSMLPHTFVNYVSNNDATCTADGTKTAKCENCDAIDTIADEGSMLPHTFVNYVSDGNATCTEDGTKTAKCENCDATDTIKDEGSKLGHDYDAVVTAPTCTEGGYTTYTCKREGCGYSYTADETAALGHSFTNYVSNNDATFEKDGTKTAKCDRCDATDTITDEGSKLPAPVVDIVNYTETKKVDYRTTITFTAAEVKNPVSGAELHWFIGGKDAGTGDKYTEKEAKKDFTVQVKYLLGGKVIAESKTETVKVNSGFFAKLIAFIRALFHKLPVIAQEFLGIERILP